MKHGSLFSGIGGFDLAASWMGWENVFHCEINPFGQKILKYYWPDAITYSDITKTDFSIHRGKIDVLTGGFPCQPYSLAGKRKGTEDERHLWPEMLRAIREVQPRWVVGENVFGIVNWDGGVVFEQIQADLEAEGYEVQPYVLPACAVNAPHKRERVWFIAHADRYGHELRRSGENRSAKIESTCEQAQRERVWADDRGTCKQGTTSDADINLRRKRRVYSSRSEETKCEQPRRTRTGRNGLADICSENITTDANCERHDERHIATVASEQGGFNSKKNNNRSIVSTWDNFPTQPPVRGRNDGLSTELDGITVSKHRNESIKAYGNAVVPELVFQIFKAIHGYEKHKR